MLIDDDELTNSIHKSIIQVWSQNKASVIVFEDAREALHQLSDMENRSKPDVIFLDLNMPFMNGWEFLEEYEKLGLLIPVCVLSSSIQKSDKERALAHPSVAEYLSKPLQPVGLDRLLTMLT